MGGRLNAWEENGHQCKLLIIRHLEKSGEATQKELYATVEDVFSKMMSPEQKRKKLTNLLQIMKKKDKTIDSRGKTSATVWFLRKQV